ncbi:lipid A deacylase LpxR family protein [Maribacter sp.]|uniref:lipid A deacylase LpxR family protein n=1 Tax=Maribacter sp. TaxID=1897614 RepID=UPI003299C48D
MKKSFLLVLLLPMLFFGQKINNLVSFRSIGSENYLRFNYDNDFFASTDKNYTQGYSLEFTNTSLAKNPINYLFFKPNSSSTIHGLALEHIGYTPSDFVSEDIQFGDRPFAAAIFLKSFAIDTNKDKKYRLGQSLSIGLIGPGAFGKEMQTKIHKLIENKIPGGWNNQIQNDFILNYKIGYEKQLLDFKNIANIHSYTSLQVGSLFTNVSFGFNTTIGILDNLYTDVTTTSKIKVYTFAHTAVNIIGYDATLQGGIITNDNPYTISSENIERFTAQLDYGLILKYKRVYLEYTRTAITKEFSSGNSANWGGFKLGFLFK